MARVEQNYKEHPISMDRWGNYTSVEVPYIVFDVIDEEAALAAVHATALQVLHNLPLYSIAIDSRADDTTFRVVALYQNDVTDRYSNYDEDMESEVSFNCGNATKHMLYAIMQDHRYGNKDAKGAIGWNGLYGKDMQIAGVDVPSADVHEVRTKVMNVSHLSTQYLRRVIDIYGCVNDRRFYGWEKGEALFLGISYSYPRNARHALVQFHFNIRINEKEVEVSGHSIGNVEGFQYISAIPIAKNGNDGLEADVSDVYVNNVLRYADFSILGV